MKRILLLSFAFLTVIAFSAMAQRTVSGKVTDDTGEALPGVNVVIKGTTTGTTTDLDGNYRLSVDEGATLVFSFVGFETQEVAVGARSTIDLSMGGATELQEVVVTAMGFQDNRDQLGVAVSKIEPDKIQKSGETGVINGLAGKAAGVQILRSTGDPGAGSYIQIRGQSTLTGGVQPLIILDGIPVYNSSLQSEATTAGVSEQSRLNDINPNDIESVQVLKGASAAALWGSRAANGVIVITTKKGKAGNKPRISFSTTYSVDEINKNHPLQTTWGQGFGMSYSPTSAFSWGDKIADRAGGADEVDTSGEFYVGDQTGTTYYPITTKNDRTVYQSDNFDEIFDKGHFLENNLSISGGSGNSTYYVSLGRLKQDGIITNNSSYERITGRVNVSSQLADYLKMSTNVSYIMTEQDRIQKGSNLAGLFLGALRTPADFDISDYTGTYTDAAGGIVEGRQRSYRRYLGNNDNPIYNNPLWTINKQLNTSNVNRMIASTEMTIDATDELSIIIRPGVDTYNDERLTYYPVFSGAEQAGRAIEETITETQFNTHFLARYSKLISSNVELTGLVGYQYNSRNLDWVWTDYSGFVINDLTSRYINTNNAPPANGNPGDFTQVTRSSAGFAQVQLGLMEQVFVNLQGRLERASSYSGSFFFPSADVAWQFTQLPALQDNGILSFGKIRVAYGEVGVEPNPYAGAQYFVASTAFDGGWGGAKASNLFGGGSFTESVARGNDKLEPEVKKEFEVGAELRFIDNRIGVSGTYYQNTNDNALFNASIAASSGFSSEYGNYGSLENKGIELEVDADVFNTGDFRWNVFANYTRNRNEVTSLFGTESIFLNGFAGTSSRIVEGEPIGVLWGGAWDRNENGDFILDANGFPGVADNEGVLGDPNPDWRGGAGMSFEYKGISLSFLFETFQGADYWNGTRGVLNYFGRSERTDVETTVSAAEASNIVNFSGNTLDTYYTPNADGSVTFRGTLEDFGGGTVALDEAWYTATGGGFGPVGEQFIDDASWTRLREVSIGYTLKSNGFRNLTKLSSIEFTLTGRNLWLQTDWEGIDPDQNLTGPSTGRGLEYFNNPNTKSYLFSVRINY